MNFNPRTAAALGLLVAFFPSSGRAEEAASRGAEPLAIQFKSHDGYDMFGKLVVPQEGKPRAVVLYVQTAEAMTVDQKRPLSATKSFQYFDVYREKLPELGIGFFSYEGRGVSMGGDLPRFEKIDWEVYETSTLDNKVEDCLAAIGALRSQPGLKATPIFLLGCSEGTLLAAEAASRAPDSVSGLVLYGVLATNLRENFKYIMSDGSFLAFRNHFDIDDDGVITKEEFKTDPHNFRAALQGLGFEVFDASKDGKLTAEDMAIRQKPLLDAVDNDNFELLQAWAKVGAAVSVPSNWFKDHFAHKPIWSFLSQLDIPVGFFHGARDNNAPIAAVKDLEKRASEAGKSKMKFYYFDMLDHSLNIGQYFVAGKLPAGHEAIFRFLDEVAPRHAEVGE